LNLPASSALLTLAVVNVTVAGVGTSFASIVKVNVLAVPSTSPLLGLLISKTTCSASSVSVSSVMFTSKVAVVALAGIVTVTVPLLAPVIV
jgi:hypothetical protein